MGSYIDHKVAIDYPQNARPDIAQRAPRFGWQELAAQWIANADLDRAEKSFFRINQGGTKIDPTERRILNARRSATGLAARAILRAGTGHNYWDRFEPATQTKIEELGGQVYKLLFEPTLSLPIKTLDVPVAGQGYGPQVLPFLFDLVNLVNDVPIPDSSHKRITRDEELPEDSDGSTTIRYLTEVRALLWRLCSVHPSSLGMHPALYFYSPTGVFQSTALLSFATLYKGWRTNDFIEFTRVRAGFEEFLMESHRSITEAIRQLGSGVRSRPRIISLWKAIIGELRANKSVREVYDTLISKDEFSFLVEPLDRLVGDTSGQEFRRGTKTAAYLRDAVKTAPKCPTCGGLLHRNGMQTGHQLARREGGSADLSNAIMQHPFCNSTVEQ